MSLLLELLSKHSMEGFQPGWSNEGGTVLWGICALAVNCEML